MTIEERFWSKVAMIPFHGCWEWIGKPTRKGYGQLWVDGKLISAHRFAWELTHGPVADGLCVLHFCDNRSCIRVDHLFLGTIADNNSDMRRKGRQRNQNLGKTHCIRGHALVPENVYYKFGDGPTGKTRRVCRTCCIASATRSQIRRREARNVGQPI